MRRCCLQYVIGDKVAITYLNKLGDLPLGLLLLLYVKPEQIK